MDRALLDDILLWATNTGSLYYGTSLPLLNRMRALHAAGKFNPRQAITAYIHTINTIVAGYNAELHTHVHLTGEERRELATMLMNRYTGEFADETEATAYASTG